MSGATGYGTSVIEASGLDSTARESNIRDSIKKYFVDNISRIEGIALLFDEYLTTPKVQGIEVDKWVSVMMGEIDLGTLSDITLEIYCCTKKDSEGFKLAQVRDKVIAYLIDTTQTDGFARIPLYRSSATVAWGNIGTMIVQIQSESRQMKAEDNSKFKVITVRLLWAAKV